MKILIRILNRLRILEYFNLYPKTKIDNTSFIIPVLEEIGKSNLYLNREKWLIRLIKASYNIINGPFIDVGANIGQTLLYIKSYKKEILYLGFEPNPTCVHYLNCLVRANSLINTNIYPTGLSEISSTVQLFLNQKVDPGATIIEGLRENQKESIFVNISNFDNAINLTEIKEKCFIKIDVEGAELQVIKGMKHFIEINRPIIVCEVLHSSNNSNLDKDKIRNDRLQLLLTELNYSISRVIHNNANIKLQMVDGFDNLIWNPNKSIEMCDYFFFPSEILEKVKSSFNFKN